jgi:hypothetical protein
MAGGTDIRLEDDSNHNTRFSGQEAVNDAKRR